MPTPSRKGPRPVLDAGQVAAFGRLLRDCRQAAGLSRAELGKRAKLSDASIKLIETGRGSPSRATLIRLVGVKALGLTWQDVVSLGGDAPQAGSASAPIRLEAAPRLNCLVAAGCAPLALEAELRRFLQGAGGHLEQWAAYHDPGSALAYLATLNQGPTAMLRSAYPIEKLAECILDTAAGPSGSVPLRLVALGSGAGALELRLARQLQAETDARDLEVCLIDQSAPLLSAALDGAAEAFAAVPVVFWGVLARFARLPELTPAYADSAERVRRRVFLLLGEALADVDEERRFLRYHLQGARAGDLLVADFLHAASPAERDPLLAAGLSSLQEHWLLGVGRRHWPPSLRFELSLTLDQLDALPRGYAVSVEAGAFVNNALYRSFSLYRFKRYEPQALIEVLRSCGWELVKTLPMEATGYLGSIVVCKRVQEGPYSNPSMSDPPVQ
ncbi:MAG: helix-turn-helix domain-containing protein [Polyangia bacterium]